MTSRIAMLRFQRKLTVGAVLMFATVAPAGEFPGAPGSSPWVNRPNDPNYPEMWQLFSHLPMDHRGTVSEAEAEAGSGMHVDRAWQLHIGDPSTVIAILDSGIRWHDRDLVDRHFLNIRELPLPQGAASYDANGDGRISVSDYLQDPRVSDVNQNQIIDAGDLIQVFANRIDEDANGYVDDIAGWDFHEGDNDPGDRTDFGHGTGEARDSVAAINNGIAGAGICGECSFIALRVNDSFVIDAHAFAEAVVYATRIGASMIQQALGSYNSSSFVQNAVDYAYDHNVLIIGSAADEASYHHNYPSTLDPIIYTNAIRYDTPDFRDATTFINFNNCSNFGARIDVATSGRSCSSEATGNLSGITGLTLSYAKRLNRNANAGQFISLIKNSADDINLGPNTSQPDRFSSFAGWDSFSGYGRTNAFTMLEAVRRDEIPPEARIKAPAWFEVFNQRTFGGLDVEIVVGPQIATNAVRLEIAHGIETHAAEWYAVPAVNGSQTVRIYPETFRSVKRTTKPLLREEFAYTLRLTVTDRQGRASEARRTVFIVDDPYLFDDFPHKLRGSGEGSGFFKDLDGDGAEEYITADGGGWIHAFSHSRGELPGFPVAGVVSRHSLHRAGFDLAHASIFAPIAGGDLDGDGQWEIVYATAEGGIGVVDGQGRHLNGFPIQLPVPDWSKSHSKGEIGHGILSSPVIADLEGDGRAEIVVSAMDGKIYAFHDNGQSVEGFPVQLAAGGVHARIVASPSIADLNLDGIADIVVGSNHVGSAAGTVFVIDGRGHAAPSLHLPGFPRRIPLARDSVLPTVGTGIPTSAVLADFDQDGVREILIHGFLGKAYLLSSTGVLKGSFSIDVPVSAVTAEDTMFTAFGHPALMKMAPDALPSPVMVGVGRNMLVSLLVGGKRVPFDHLVGVWDATTRQMIDGYPRIMDDMQLGSAFVSGDLDGDGRDEIIGGSGGHFIRGFGASGELPGFPHFTGGWTYGSPSLGDFDGDGQLDLATTTREGFLFVWRLDRSDRQSLTWPVYKFNPQRTGAFGGR